MCDTTQLYVAEEVYTVKKACAMASVIGSISKGGCISLRISKRSQISLLLFRSHSLEDSQIHSNIHDI